MAGSVGDVLIAVSLPLAISFLAGVAAAIRPIGDRLRSALQHFAAGLIFAAVAVELLPQIHDREPAAIVAGFAAGLGLMLAVRAVSTRLRSTEAADAGGATLAATVGVDLLIDGLLLGIAFSVGTEEGVLLTVGLCAEVLSVSLSVAGELSRGGAQRRAVIATPPALTLALAVGAVIGVATLGELSGPAFAAVLGLGSAALLYLAVEELLTEAHAVPETMPITASFFAGFLLLLLL